MLDTNTDRFHKYDIVGYNNFLQSPQAACYGKVHFLCFEKFTAKDLQEIKEQDNGQKKCVFLSLNEPHWYESNQSLSLQFGIFRNLLIEHQLFNIDFYIPTFGYAYHNDIETLNQNHYGWNFLRYEVEIPFATLRMEKVDFSKFNGELNVDKIKHKFLHMNFAHRMHRQLFSKFLIRESLIEGNCVAINKVGPDTYNRKAYEKNWEGACVPTKNNDGWFYNQRLLDLYRDTPLVTHKNQNIDDNIGSYHHDFVCKSAIYIISETIFDHPYPIFSEKVISALLSNRPFLLIGPVHSLKALKERGYKTWDNIIDESYDNISDPNQRMEQIFDLVRKINEKPLDELRQNVLQSKDKLVHNQKLMLENFLKYTKETQ
jgi:hypothetical protein